MSATLTACLDSDTAEIVRCPTSLPLAFQPYIDPAGFGVITCFFNPSRYRTKLLNYRIFRESLHVSGIPCITVECLFPGQTSELSGWSGVHTVIGPHAMWLKERLLNIAIARMPSSWTNIAWLDCDVLFDDPAWAIRTVEQLETQVVVQPFSEVVRLQKGRTWGRQLDAQWQSFGAIAKRKPNHLLRGNFQQHGHTGFGWAARRDLLTRHGLYDGCVAGSGDHMMAHAFAGDWNSPCVQRTLTSSHHHDHFVAWAQDVYSSVRARVSCAPGTIYHLWHGATADRRYGAREREFALFDFDPKTDLRLGENGCWEWASHKPALHAWAAEYFAKRKEDGAEADQEPTALSCGTLNNRQGEMLDLQRVARCRPGLANRVMTAIGGSLVLCLVTPAAVYLSADSRYAGAPRTLRNAARKVLPCGPTALCGISGLLRFTRTDYDVREDAPASQVTFELADFIDHIDLSGSDQEPVLASLFAETLFRTLAPIWADFAHQLQRPFGAVNPGSDGPTHSLAQILYVNRSVSGHAFICAIDLAHSMRRSHSGEYSSVLERPVVRPVFHGPVTRERFYIHGRKSCIRLEPFPGAIKSDAQALEAIDRAFRTTQQESRCAKAIGGPVDIAAIDAMGRRWLRQKPAQGHESDG